MQHLKLTILLLAVSFATSVSAMNEAEYQQASDLFIAAVNGDEDHIINARKYFNKLSEPAPYDILINTYLGSLETMMAAHVYMPWTKMKHAETGSEQIDDALDEIAKKHETTTLGGTAISMRIQSVAAHTYFQFPRFLNRYQDAKDLVVEIFESPLFATSDIEYKNGIYKLAAAIAEQDNDKTRQADYLAKVK